MEHPRWKTVKEIKDQLNQYNDDAFVFIQPHKFMIDYPFYIFQSGNGNIYFRFYKDLQLKLPIEIKIHTIKEKIKGIIRKVKHET